MIAAIELALLQQLTSAAEAGVLGYRYASTDTFPDEFEEYLKATPNLRTPAAWSAFLGMAEGQDVNDENGLTATGNFVLVVAASNLRNEQQTRHGDGTGPGSYQLMEDAIRLLSGNWLDPLPLVRPVEVTGARPVARTSQMKEQKLSMMAITLRCRMPIGSFDADLGEFRTLHADWDVPLHGNVEAPLPAEVHDAEDLIEVPQ